MTPVLARTRPDRSFERLYRRHVGDVYRYALAVMRNQPDAEDVTQTTFMNAYRAFQRAERPEKAQNWLIAIAHNVCRQRFRQTARRPTEVSFEDDVADRLIADEDTPSGEDIRRALGHLAFNQRAALVMRELEGRSYAEIAEILDLSTSAVETLIFRARRALREQLEGSLTCGEAEFAISRQLDGRLPRGERGQLRAHLRECEECAGFARRQRAQRGALKTLSLVPVPGSLLSLFGGGGGAAVGTGLALKAAAAVTAGLAIGGASYEGVRHVPWHAERPTAAAQNAVGGIAAARDPAFASRGTSRVAPAAGSGRHGHAVKTKNVKPKKAKKAANQTGLARNGILASHGRAAEQSNRAHAAGGARVHQTAKLKPKPKRLRLPGPIGEHPVHRRGKKR